MKDTTLTKKRQGVRTEEHSHAGLDTFEKGSISAMAGISAVIGIWAAACFIGAMFTSGGPLNLVYGWFKAVSGL